MQGYLGYTATWAGYATAFTDVSAVIASPIVGKLSARVDPRKLVSFGILWLGATTMLRIQWNSGADFWTLAIPQFLQGAGIPFFFIPITALGLGAVEDAEVASAAGLMSFLRTMSAAIFTSIATTSWDDDTRVARSEVVSKLHASDVLTSLQDKGFRSTKSDEPHTAKGYVSDFDLLVIVNQKEWTDRAAWWTKAEERLIYEHTIMRKLRTPVNFIVHSLQQVNDGLAHGRFFFMDVARDGIAVYESDDTEMHQPQPKTPSDALAMAKEYCEEWLPAAMSRFKLAKFAIDQRLNKDAAFDLYQTAERLYHCGISVDELAWLSERVSNLGQTFATTCDERICVLRLNAAEG